MIVDCEWFVNLTVSKFRVLFTQATFTFAAIVFGKVLSVIIQVHRHGNRRKRSFCLLQLLRGRQVFSTEIHHWILIFISSQSDKQTHIRHSIHTLNKWSIDANDSFPLGQQGKGKNLNSPRLTLQVLRTFGKWDTFSPPSVICFNFATIATREEARKWLRDVAMKEKLIFSSTSFSLYTLNHLFHQKTTSSSWWHSKGEGRELFLLF